MANKTILVTGSTGWLGGKLCEALVARGVKVVGLARRETKITGVKSLTADLATGAGLEKLNDFRGASARTGGRKARRCTRVEMTGNG